MKIFHQIVDLTEGFCSILNWEGADILPQIRPRKIPASRGPYNFAKNSNVCNCDWYLTLFVLLDYPKYIYTITMELSILHSKGSQVEIKNYDLCY